MTGSLVSGPAPIRYRPIRRWADAGMAKCSAHEYRLICRKHVRAAPELGTQA